MQTLNSKQQLNREKTVFFSRYISFFGQYGRHPMVRYLGSCILPLFLARRVNNSPCTTVHTTFHSFSLCIYSSSKVWIFPPHKKLFPSFSILPVILWLYLSSHSTHSMSSFASLRWIRLHEPSSRGHGSGDPAFSAKFSGENGGGPVIDG